MFFEKMQTRKNDGFTLVELIVVIAILAILAGIAVPAYSGYIEKANVAADEQLLHAINTAFAAATSGNGVVATNADLPIAADGTVNPATLSVTPASDKVVEDFKTFYAGNESSAFKIYTTLYYNRANGIFANNYTVTVTYNGKEIAFTAEQIESLKNSTFMNESAGLGIGALLGKLDFTTNFAQALLTEDPENQSDALNAVIGDPVFHKALAGYLGIDTTDKTPDEIAAAIGAWGEANPDNQGEVMSNALVLYAAQNSTMSAKDATTLLTGNAKQSILDTLRGTETTEANTPAAMAQAALAYGMYTSYAHYTGDEELIAKAASPNALDVMDMLNDDAFKAYISGAQGQKDLDGYLNAMGMIDDAAKDSTIAGGVLNNGFTDQNLNKLLQDALK